MLEKERQTGIFIFWEEVNGVKLEKLGEIE
jgi:hypothetical protein